MHLGGYGYYIKVLPFNFYYQITDLLHCYECIIYLWTKHGCYGHVEVRTKALYEGVKEAFYLPRTHKQTEDHCHKKGPFQKRHAKLKAVFFSSFFCTLIVL